MTAAPHIRAAREKLAQALVHEQRGDAEAAMATVIETLALIGLAQSALRTPRR